ncbi:hypothetical protein [Thiococcus pfennigii]|uniref:hypothetical protein n=1 Tax=Thiococcus pfennigii TaxID=1057 RepID=UPI001907E86C|nr:hypothetical protein [Thiococcus pfennigii]
MTQRYLEAIGSGCLIVGESPQEIIDLFGFDPVIPVDWKNPVKQLFNVLKSIESYQEHVDRCRLRFLEVGTFSSRVEKIHEELINIQLV